jgi:hypothetical protein
MPFLIGYEIPANTPTFDASRGQGPQHDGLVFCKLTAIKKSDKPKSVQAECSWVVESPPHRAGEAFKTWENVGAKAGAAPEFANVCKQKVVLLLSAGGAQAFQDTTKSPAIPADFDLEKLVGKSGFPIYTRPAEGDKREQADLLDRAKAAKVQAGEAFPDTRQTKQAGGASGGRRAGNAGGGNRSAAPDDPFATEDAAGGAEEAAGTDPFGV